MADYWRGYKLIQRDDVWLYADTMQPVFVEPVRDCGHCGLPNTPEGHDGCLGTLPGVMNACCGHGEEQSAYIQFWDGRRFAGTEAQMLQRKGVW